MLVILNLLSNSIKFTPPHGSITVSVRTVNPPIHHSTTPFPSSSPSLDTVVEIDNLISVIDDDRFKADEKKSIPERRCLLSSSRPHRAAQHDTQLQITFNKYTVDEEDHNLIESINDLIWCEFEITDTGCGMTVDEIDKLFRPYAQAKLSTTRKYGKSKTSSFTALRCTYGKTY